MPKYRKLHVKITESLDLNDMPDDFTRLFWVLLPLGLCREGRGIDNPSWIKSKIFPLREDIKNGEINTAIDWLEQRGMIIRYQVEGRKYFYLPKFHTYQGSTTKEAESNYPSPPELLQTYSGVSRGDMNTEYCILNNESESESKSDQPFSQLQTAFINASGIPDFGMKPRAIEAGRRMVKAGIVPDDITQAIEELGDDYTITDLASVEKAAYNVKRKRMGKDKQDKSSSLSVIEELIEEENGKQ